MVWNETTHMQYRRSLHRFETDVTDDEWSVVTPHLPAASKRRQVSWDSPSSAIGFFVKCHRILHRRQRPTDPPPAVLAFSSEINIG